MASLTDLRDRLAACLTELHVDVDDVTLLRQGGQRVLAVTLDADGGIDLDRVAAASRLVSEYLDSADDLGEDAYVLEVSSRGVGAPLTKPVHWQRNVGRLVTVSGSSLNATGRIVSFADPVATLLVKGQERAVDVRDLAHAVIEVEFNRKDEGAAADGH